MLLKQVTYGDLTATGVSTLSNVDINAGAIDNTAIGANSADTGAFTTHASGDATVTGALDITGESTLTDLTATGTSTLSTVDINGGAIDGTYRSTTAASGSFTTLVLLVMQQLLVNHFRKFLRCKWSRNRWRL